MKKLTHILLESINAANPNNKLQERQLSKIFDRWWPELENTLNGLEPKIFSEGSNEQDSTLSNTELSNILEELLEISRINQKLLRDPTQILPEDYLKNITILNPIYDKSYLLRKFSLYDDSFEAIFLSYKQLIDRIASCKNENKSTSAIEGVVDAVAMLHTPLENLFSKLGYNWPSIHKLRPDL